MTKIVSEQGIEVVTSAKVTRVEGGETKTVVAEVGGQERRFPAAEVLVATGRRPVLDGLDIDKAGIQRDERGNLVLDDELRTTNSKVFAAGDVTGAPQFVYVAATQGTLAADNAVSNAGRKMDYKALPRVTFTTPNIAAVGLTDAQAQEQGYECESRVLELQDVPRAIVNLDTRGAIKIVAERGTGKILGVHAIAANAGDIILAGVYAVKFGLTVQYTCRADEACVSSSPLLGTPWDSGRSGALQCAARRHCSLPAGSLRPRGRFCRTPS